MGAVPILANTFDFTCGCTMQIRLLRTPDGQIGQALGALPCDAHRPEETAEGTLRPWVPDGLEIASFRVERHAPPEEQRRLIVAPSTQQVVEEFKQKLEDNR